MPQLDRATLTALGQGTSIEDLCSQNGWSREEFDQRWHETIQARVPDHADRSAAVDTTVTITRDELGIPHIYAKNEGDLFFGFGLAMAEDRLFQLDYLRRKGQGRLAEILGRAGLGADLVARTVGLNRIARREWDRLSPEVRARVQRFSDGINACIESMQDNTPVEFALLDYHPEPWSPIDCIAIEVEFRWYLTGRFPIITIPELAKRTLGEGAR